MKKRGYAMRGYYTATALALTLVAEPVLAQTKSQPEDVVSDTAISDIIVTGTRQTGMRAEDSAAPIQSVGSAALQRVGQPNLIQSIAQNVPSFNAEAQALDAAGLTLSASLRGLNPNDTLVLINGKRRHTTSNLHVDGSAFQGAAAADLSLIPVDSIARVEVLQDGAAAQYGTDAVAGVVNIILKDSKSAGSITASGGSYYAGDGATANVAINKGFDLGGRGFLNLTGEFRFHDYSQQGGPDARFFNPDGSIKAANNSVDAAGLPGASNSPRVNRIFGDARSTLYNTSYNGGYDIADGVSLYSFGSYSYRTASAFQNYRAPSRVIASPVLGVGGSPSTPGELVPFPNGFSPRLGLTENDYASTIGAKGNIANWTWDLSTTYGRDLIQLKTLDSANASLFVNTHTTPRDFYDGSFLASQWTSNLDVTHTIDLGLASPLNVAVGLEQRRDVYRIGQGDFYSTYQEGGQAFPGFQASDAARHERNNFSAYLDLAADLTDKLHLDLAGRYEHYSDFGSTKVGKATARYDFSRAFAIRGTISNGFRAPTLAEEYYSATNVSPAFAIVNLPANSAAAQVLGFQNLKPERSTNYSAGMVLHPASHLQITVDGYQITLRNRIVSTGALLGLYGTTVISQGVLDAVAAHGNVLDPTVQIVGVATFTNAAATRTRGVEATATYSSRLFDLGAVDWSLGFNYNLTRVLSQAPLPAQAANPAFGQTAVLSPTALSFLTTASPRVKTVLGAYFHSGPLGVNLRETLYGSSSEIVSFDGTGVGGVEERIPFTGITDLEVSYQLSSSLGIRIGANNLFNKKPPRTPDIADGSGGVRPADGASNVYRTPLVFSPYGINGGYYYGRITWSF